MKKVIIGDIEDKISVDRVSGVDYIGACFPAQQKGIVKKTCYLSSQYHFTTLQANGNEWASYTSPDLHKILFNLIRGGAKVYIFDSSKELARWLAE